MKKPYEPTSCESCATRRLVAALGDVATELGEGRDPAQRVAPVRGVDRCDVHEAHAIVEPERRVAKTLGSALGELLVDPPDQALVLLDALGLYLVANDDLSHPAPPGVAASTAADRW